MVVSLSCTERWSDLIILELLVSNSSITSFAGFRHGTETTSGQLPVMTQAALLSLPRCFKSQ